jgi:3'(2'), 5'-bisphosphate nucleotidase
VCELLDEVREIAAEAAQQILAVYARDFDTEQKADGSLLTEADRQAHKLICRRLAELTPDLPVLSEESAAVDYEERSAWRRFWLVDPLDGTREFVNRNGEFTVNIALISNGQPELGVVHVPVTGLSYFACQGRGAFREEGDAPPRKIRAREYRGGAARVMASRSHAGSHVRTFLERLAEQQGDYQAESIGSSLKLCMVAEGRADVYPRLGPTSEWDTAAAQCVVEAAGGRVTDLHNQPLAYNKPSLLNPWFIVTGAGTFDWLALTRGLRD